jgi:hypothetical protein
MDFYEVLDHGVDLLRRRSRVTYRTVKLQFKLDDEALEVLKDELLKAQRLAVDEVEWEWPGWRASPGAAGSLPSRPAPANSYP